MSVNFVTSVVHESKTFPGVSYVLHKMSEARRAQLRLRIAEPTSRIRNILREMDHLEAQYNPTPENPRPEEATQRLMDLADKMEQITSDEVNPHWLIWGVKKLEGLQIDGVDATPKMLAEDGPPALFHEIVDEIKKLAQLNGEEEKNSASPIISGEPMVGETKGSSAVDASSTVSSEPEIAASISQS